MKPDSMSRVVERLPETELGQYRSGYRTGMAEQVEGMRLSHDPYAAVWGTPDQMAKASMLFPMACRTSAVRLSSLSMDARLTGR